VYDDSEDLVENFMYKILQLPAALK
jgi:hypothetical protein